MKPEPALRGACRAEGSCAKATTGDDKVVGDGMVAKAEYVKQGDLPDKKRDGVQVWKSEAEEPVGQESERS